MIECLDDRIVEILCVKAREECRNGAGMWLREGAGEMLREDKCAGMLSQPASLPSTTCTATATTRSRRLQHERYGNFSMDQYASTWNV